MSGILALWNTDGQPVDRELLARLHATLAHRGPDGSAQWLEGAAGFACQLSRVTPESVHEIQPWRDARGTALVFDGRLDNREELIERLTAIVPVDHEMSDPALILAAYPIAGDQLPAWLAGDFALALFDRRHQRLVLARDALGIRPLYYWRDHRTVVCASEIKAILAHPAVRAQPNDDRLADMLFGGMDDQEPTLFTEIASVPPAHCVLITPQRVTRQRYWDFDLQHRIRLGSFQEYAAAFRDVLTTAVRRRLRSRHPVAVSLSGGLDSSSIFCVGRSLLAQQRVAAPDLLGVSYAPPPGSPADEEAFLRAIEEERGVAIHRVPLGTGTSLDGAHEAVWSTEMPWLDEHWDTLHRFMARVRALDARVVLTGHWGDQMLFPQAYLVDLIRQGAWGMTRRHLREFPRWMTDVEPHIFRHMLASDLAKYGLPASLTALARALRRRTRPRSPWYAPAFRARALRRRARPSAVRLPSASAHARELYGQARNAHHVACMEWDNKMAALHGAEMTFPFLDRDVVSFLMAIPGEYVNYDGVPKGLLREALRGVLPAPIVQRRWKADFTSLVNANVRQMFAEYARCVMSGRRAIARGYLDAPVLGAHVAMLHAQLSGDTAEAAWSLSDLVGLELWLHTFFQGGAHEETRDDRSEAAVPAATAEAVR